MKSNGAVGALVIVVVGGLSAACTTEAVGDGQPGGSLYGLVNGTEGAKTDQPSNGTTQAGQTANPSTPTAPSTKGGACYTSGNTTCDACANAKCCDVINACVGNQACSSLYECLDSCWDTSCESSCNQRFQTGVTLYQRASQCVRGTCGASCSG